MIPFFLLNFLQDKCKGVLPDGSFPQRPRQSGQVDGEASDSIPFWPGKEEAGEETSDDLDNDSQVWPPFLVFWFISSFFFWILYPLWLY